jgi:hypothetical protein
MHANEARNDGARVLTMNETDCPGVTESGSLYPTISTPSADCESVLPGLTLSDAHYRSAIVPNGGALPRRQQSPLFRIQLLSLVGSNSMQQLPLRPDDDRTEHDMLRLLERVDRGPRDILRA